LTDCPELGNIVIEVICLVVRILIIWPSRGCRDISIVPVANVPAGSIRTYQSVSMRVILKPVAGVA
jgi:hypothetical protein